MDRVEKEALREMLLGVFENRWDEQKLLALGKKYVGKGFKLLARLAGPKCYLGEALQILRHSSLSIVDIGIWVSRYLKFTPRQARAMARLVLKIAEETKARRANGNENFYHNEKHTINVLISSIVLSKAEGLSLKDIQLNALAAVIHDDGHDQLPNECASVNNGGCARRLEEEALRRNGVEILNRGDLWEQWEITVDSGKPLTPLPTDDVKKITQRVMDTCFPDDAMAVRAQYLAYIERGKPVPEDLAARAVLTSADIMESMTLAGNSITAYAVYQERLYTILLEATKKNLSIQEQHQKVKDITQMCISPKGRHTFVQIFGPYLKAVEKLGLKTESQQLIAKLTRQARREKNEHGFKRMVLHTERGKVVLRRPINDIFVA